MQLESESDVVKWYLKIMEQGVDTKEVVKSHAILKDKHAELERTTTKQINKLEKDNSRLTAELAQALETIKTQ